MIPLVSIIIATYNRCQILKGTLVAHGLSQVSVHCR